MKKNTLLASAAFLIPFCFTSQLAGAQNYQQVHQNAVVIDTHNDVLISVMDGLSIEKDLTGKTHTDLARLNKGGVDVQIFSVWCDETYGKGTAFRYANAQIDSLKAIVDRNPDKMMMVGTPEELQAAVRQQKIGAMIGVEGGHMIESNLAYLDSLYKRGVRYMTLTWNNSTPWATSAMDESDGKIPKNKRGLTSHGKKIVKRMNQLGMMVDLSHVGERTFWDAINTSTKPVLVSHSNAYALAPHFRNLKDDQIKAVAKNGGVIHLNFFSGFLDSEFEQRNKDFQARHQEEIDSLRQQKWSRGDIMLLMEEKYPEDVKQVRPPLSQLMDHLDYIVKLVGVDHVGLGSDFDGITSAPQQLDSVEDFPLITRELMARGYSTTDIEKILGGNFIRAFKANSN